MKAITEKQKIAAERFTDIKIEKDEMNARRYKAVIHNYTIAYFIITEEGAEVDEIIGGPSTSELESLYKAFRQIESN